MTDEESDALLKPAHVWPAHVALPLKGEGGLGQCLEGQLNAFLGGYFDGALRDATLLLVAPEEEMPAWSLRLLSGNTECAWSLETVLSMLGNPLEPEEEDADERPQFLALADVLEAQAKRIRAMVADHG